MAGNAEKGEIMKRIFLTMNIIFCSLNCWAGILDIDYIRPSPTITAVTSITLPGAGWFYLDSVTNDPYLSGNYQLKGWFYLLTTSVLVCYIVNNLSSKNKTFIWPAFALTIGIRFTDIFSSIDAAERERYANSFEYINYKDKR